VYGYRPVLRCSEDRGAVIASCRRREAEGCVRGEDQRRLARGLAAACVCRHANVGGKRVVSSKGLKRRLVPGQEKGARPSADQRPLVRGFPGQPGARRMWSRQPSSVSARQASTHAKRGKRRRREDPWMRRKPTYPCAAALPKQPGPLAGPFRGTL